MSRYVELYKAAFGYFPCPAGDPEMEAFYDAAFKAGAEAEREACAKVFDGPVWSYDYREIAAAIRARGEK